MSVPTPSLHPAPVSEATLDRLKALLREMFHLDRGDLDFGLYRIMNMKSREIAAFLDNDLLPQVKGTLAGITAEDRAALDNDLVSTIEMATSLGGVDPEVTDKVKSLREQLAAAKADADDEADVYNHIANFFGRYYNEGDFMSQRRYSGGGRSSYLIPYDGEEVKLHWANADQYYVKTTENYAVYVFAAGARRVRLEIAAADNEKDNVKEANGKQRRFVLAGSNPVGIEDGDLVIRFEHRPLTEGEKKTYHGNGNHLQHRINEAATERILNLKTLPPDWLAFLAAPAPTDANGERTVLAKHLERYTAKNSFDYFIHKDLGGFLRRELDLYLKSEALNLDDLAMGNAARLRRALARMRTIRHVADKIITFLAQLEDFQKHLWLKKKFVLETQYCVTLDKVPEALYAAIVTNNAQCEEWVRLFAIEEIVADHAPLLPKEERGKHVSYSKPLTPAFLKANPYLVLDTRYFNRDFTDRLLAALSDAGPLDEHMDGLLVHGENFQALNVLQERYRGQVQCVHIDPPYNTDTSGFIYKNNYRHSSWLAMMANHISSSVNLLSGCGSFLCHIDENEYERLHMLFEKFPIANAGTVVWDKRNPMTGGSGVATQHEYVIWRSSTEKAISAGNGNLQRMLNKASDLIENNDGVVNETVRKQYADWVRNHSFLSGGEKAYSLLDDTGGIYQSVSLRAPEPRTDPKFFVPLMHPKTNQPCSIPPNGFSRTPETLADMMKKGEIIFGKDHTTQPRQKMILSEGSKRQITSIVSDATRGKSDLDSMGLEDFPYSHSVRFYNKLIEAASESRSDRVIDYFAGSGTTGHAVINLNREDAGNRKYILVEIGHHFDDVLLPRIKKVIYSEDWKDGKPVSRKGSTQFFKYIRLESYEDTLDGLELTPPNTAQQDLLAHNAAFAEDYRLRYALGAETSGSACLLGGHFTDPFAYTLSIVRDGTRRDVPADLPETFTYLIGLRIQSRQWLDGVLAITGANAEEQSCLILWRNLNEIDNAALDTWFTRHRAQFSKSLAIIYVNGDHTLNALKQPGETWTAQTIEPVFRRLMFQENP